MVTLQTIKVKLNNELSLINSATSRQDTTLHSAIANLIEGYGSGTIDSEVIEFDSTNSKVKSFTTLAEATYPSSTSSIIADYADPTNDPGKDKPLGYTVSNLSSGKMLVIDEDLGNSYLKEFEGNSVTIYNLIPNHIYSIIFFGNNSIQKMIRIKDTTKYRQLRMEGEASNVRDVGGKSCTGGKVRYGMIYRGQRLHATSADRINTNDKKILWNLSQIGYQIDMRTDEYTGVNSGRSPISNYTIFDHQSLPGGYAPYFGLNSEYKDNAKTIVENTMKKIAAGIPVYINCQDGADRTGTLVSILLGICGVSQSDIEIDYELSSFVLDRKRTRNEWENWRNHIQALSGTNKYITYCLELGISQSLINEVREKLIEQDGSESIEIPVDKTNLLTEVGYDDNKRLNSSGTTSSGTGYRATGLIPVTKGDTLEFENFKVASSSTISEPYYKNGYTKVYVLNEDNAIIYNDNVNNLNKTVNNCVIDADGFITKITLNQIGGNDLSTMAYIRLSAYMEDNPAIYKI